MTKPETFPVTGEDSVGSKTRLVFVAKPGSVHALSPKVNERLRETDFDQERCQACMPRILGRSLRRTLWQFRPSTRCFQTTLTDDILELEKVRM